VLLETQQLKN